MIGTEGYCLAKIVRPCIQPHHHDHPCGKSYDIEEDLFVSLAFAESTWYFLSSSFGLDESLNYFVDFAFLETDANLLARFIVRYTNG